MKNKLSYILILIACNILTATFTYTITLNHINKKNRIEQTPPPISSVEIQQSGENNNILSDFDANIKDTLNNDDIIVADDFYEETIPILFPDDEEKQRGLEEAAEKEPKFKEFLLGYLENDGQVTGGFTAEEINSEHPHFLQYDIRWGYKEYGTTVLGFTGCAPTALSMVVLQLTGDTGATPDKIADYCTENGLYIPNQGTSWNLFTGASSAFGVKGKILPFNDKRMKEELEAGHPIIISLRPGDFTQNGHIAVIVGVEDGKYKINDPASTIRTSMLWDFETLIPQIKQLWVFEKI